MNTLTSPAAQADVDVLMTGLQQQYQRYLELAGLAAICRDPVSLEERAGVVATAPIGSLLKVENQR